MPYVQIEQTTKVGVTPNTPASGWTIQHVIEPSSTAIGSNALENNESGSMNTAIGHNSLNKNTSGSYNTAVGSSSLKNSGARIWNTAIGAGAMVQSNGDFNTGIGVNALAYLTGHRNSVLGSRAGLNLNGNCNVAIGEESLVGNNLNTNYSVGIGDGVNLPSSNMDYQANIHNRLMFVEFFHTVHTIADVYAVLNPLINLYSSTTGSKRQNTGAMGYYGAENVQLLQRTSAGAIDIFNNNNSRLISLTATNYTLLTEDLAFWFIPNNTHKNRKRPVELIYSSWETDKTYNIYNVVSYQGAYYECIKSHVSNELYNPTNTTYWKSI